MWKFTHKFTVILGNTKQNGMIYFYVSINICENKFHFRFFIFLLHCLYKILWKIVDTTVFGKILGYGTCHKKSQLVQRGISSDSQRGISSKPQKWISSHFIRATFSPEMNVFHQYWTHKITTSLLSVSIELKWVKALPGATIEN